MPHAPGACLTYGGGLLGVQSKCTKFSVSHAKGSGDTPTFIYGFSIDLMLRNFGKFSKKFRNFYFLKNEFSDLLNAVNC